MLFFMIFGLIVLTTLSLISWSLSFSGALFFLQDAHREFDRVDGAFTLGSFLIAAASTSAAIVIGVAL